MTVSLLKRIHFFLPVAYALVIFSFYFSYASAQYYPTAEEQEQIQLKLTQAEYFAKTLNIKKALQIINDLKNQYPDHSIILQKEAEILQESQNYHTALDALEKAYRLTPENEDIQSEREKLKRHHRSSLTASREIITAKDSLEQITRSTGTIAYQPTKKLGITIENNHIRVASLTRANGQIKSFHGDRQRGAVIYIDNKKNNDILTTEIFFDKKNLGVSGSYRWQKNTYYTTLEAALNKPNWQYLQTILDYGTKSHLQLTHNRRLTPQTSANLQGAINRYSLEGVSNAASSITAQAEIHYRLPYHTLVQKLFKSNTFVTLNYHIDAEYALEKKQKRDDSGNLFYPLPIQSREIHSANIHINKIVSDKLHIEGFAGYSYNRLGKHAPSLGTSLTYQLNKQLAVSASASRDISTTKNSGSNETTDTILFTIKWLW